MSLPVRSVLGVVLAALVLSGCSSGGAGDKKEEADRLPDVSLEPLTSGKSVDLESLRGPTVINLWASWCVPCVRELPLYQAFSEKYDGKVDVVGIDFQETNREKAREMASDAAVDYPLYADPDGELRAVGLPKVILVDPAGRVAHEAYVEIKSVAELERLVETHLKVTS